MNASHRCPKWSSVLVCVVAVCCMAAPAHAATYSGGSGTEGDPYLISIPQDLVTLANTANSADWANHFLMTQDIDMSGITGFTPIGNDPYAGGTGFTGVFDGGGHVVRNLTINLPTRDCVGLFGKISGASCQVRDLGMQGCAVTGNGQVGGLIGGIDNGTVTACYATGSVTGTYHWVGGLIGFINNGTVTACYATGSVTDTAGWHVGGLVGMNAYGIVTACYATGVVTGSVGHEAGGLVGHNDSTVKASLWGIETSGQSGSSGGKGLTTAQLKTLTIFRNAGWAGYGWVMADGQYPRLPWEGTGAFPIPAPEPVPVSGSGTEADPYRVGTTAQFALLSWHTSILDKRMLLTTDLDCAEVALWPIGDLGPLTGVFDGGGHVIRNAVIRQPDSDYVGVFAAVGTGGVIRNLGVENADIAGRWYVGGLVGNQLSGTILGCYATGAVAGNVDVGGLVGLNFGNPISGCYATSAVTGSSGVGGLVGENRAGTVAGCYATGAVTGIIGAGNNSVGGLVGLNYYGDGTVTSCYATGAASGVTRVGGLIGSNGSGAIVTDCYATGAVTGETNLGGLLGFGSGGTVTASFWDITVGGPDNGFGTGLPTSQMQQRATFESAGWDFTGSPPVWFIFEGQSYPYLFGLPIPVGSISGTLITASATQGKSADPKNCSVDILATDGNGNRVGSLYSGSVFTEDVNEIPNAQYGGHGAFPNYIYVPWPIEVSALEFMPLCDGPLEYTIDIWTPVGSFYHHEEQLTASAGEHVSVSVPEYPVLPVVSKIAFVFFVVLMVGIGVRQTRPN